MNKNAYQQDFVPYIIKWGRIINLYAILISFLPVAIVFWYYGYKPNSSAMIVEAPAAVSVVGVMWFSDPIAYYPILGLSGTYMAHLSGNTANLKVPIAAIAQDAVGVELGSEKGNIISTIAMAVSSLVCLLFLTIAVIAGSGILSMMPEKVTSALTYVLPSLHAALLARLTAGNAKVRFIALGFALVGFILYKLGLFGFLPGNPTYVIIFLSVFGTIGVARIMDAKGNK